MENEELKYELPENYEELKKAANRTADWKARLAAVEELGQWNNKQTIDILTRIVTSDPVYTVQEAAYLKLKSFGEDIKAPSKNKPELVKGVSKIILRIKKSLPKDHTYEEFKEKLKKMRIDVYDIYEGEKGAEFDAWLQKNWTAAGTERRGK